MIKTNKTTQCEVEGCAKQNFAQHLCSAHYQQVRRHGKVTHITINHRRKIRWSGWRAQQQQAQQGKKAHKAP